MLKTSLLFLSIILCSLSYGQNRFIINNDAYVVMENGAKIVLENNNTNALQTTGTGGNITTTSESEEIIWNIGTNAGVYTIPWTTLSPFVKMPLEMNLTSAGVGSGYFSFSTYKTTSANLPLPTGVTNLFSGPSITDNSLKVIDRFWGIDARGYTTKPNATLSFSYDIAEISAPNTITEANLQAQRWNPTPSSWEDLLFGAQSPTKVDNVVITDADFFKIWTLTDNSFPLPVELINFDVQLIGSREVSITWATLSEINNDYFEVQRSENGTEFTSFRIIKGVGNSQTSIAYSTTDFSPYNNVSYYRLKQVDLDGSFSYSEIKAVAIDGFYSIYLFPNPTNNIVQVETNFASDGIVNYQVLDLTGKVVFSKTNAVKKGNQQTILPISNLGTGHYFLRINLNDSTIKTLKFNKI